MINKGNFRLAFEGKTIDANYVISLLLEHDIPAFRKDDMMSQVFPLFVSAGRLHPVKVYVEKHKLVRAQKIIDIYLDPE